MKKWVSSIVKVRRDVDQKLVGKMQPLRSVVHVPVVEGCVLRTS